MNSLRYLAIDLFLYDLYDEVQKTRLFKLFKPSEKFYQERFSRVENGYYYAFKLEDSGALQIDYSGIKDDWGSVTNLDQIQVFKNVILEKADTVPHKFGRSWFISAQIIDHELPDAVAKNCYHALNLSQDKNWDYDLKGKGEIQNVSFFELENLDINAKGATLLVFWWKWHCKIQSDRPSKTRAFDLWFTSLIYHLILCRSDGANHSLHVIICLFSPDFPKEEIQSMMSQLYKNFLRLFFYRNKVIWVYEQSRIRKCIFTKAQDTAQQIYNKIKSEPHNLDVLQETLAEDLLPILYDYELHLGRLQSQVITIDTNLSNYKARVQKLKEYGVNSNLDFLDRFSTTATEEWLTYIKADNATFTAGLRVLETFIKTVQGITEIEKAKNDRTFNQTIAIATVGVSTAALAASTLSEQADIIVKDILDVQPNQPITPLYAWLNAGLPFGLSIVIGALFSIATWAWLNRRVNQHR